MKMEAATQREIKMKRILKCRVRAKTSKEVWHWPIHDCCSKQSKWLVYQHLEGLDKSFVDMCEKVSFGNGGRC